MARPITVHRRGLTVARIVSGLAAVYAIVALGRGSLPAFQALPGGEPILLLGDRDYPPLSYIEDGIAKGLDVEIAKAVGKALGRDVRVQLVEWNLAQRRVLDGEADGLTDMAISDERRALYEFGDSTVTHEYGIFVRSGETRIRGTGDLSGKEVGATLGGLPRQFLQKQPGVHLVTLENYDDGFARLVSGNLDAVAADTWVGAYVGEQRGLKSIAIAGLPFASVRASIAVKKGNVALAAEINRAIRALKADGTIDRIAAQWRPQEMIFLSRERVLFYEEAGAATIVAVLLASLALWITTLKKQIRARKRTELALSESGQRLGLALSAAEMGTWHWIASSDQDLRDASLNRILGLPPVDSAQSRQDFLDRIHPDDRAATNTEFDRAVRDRDAYSAEFRIVRPDGSLRWLRGRGRPFYAKSGGLAYFTGAVADVTSQRQAEQRGQLLAHALRSTDDCVHITDAAGRILYVNDAFLRIYEYEERELVGHSIAMVRAVSGDVPDIAKLGARPGGWRGEMLNRSKSGRVFPVALSTSLVRDDHGQGLAVVSVARDISSEKQAQESLRTSEERFAKAFEASPDCIALVDFASGGVLEINERFEEMTGYSRSEILGRPLAGLGILVNASNRDAIIRKLSETGSMRDFEYQIRRKDGNIRTFSQSAESIEIGGRSCYLAVVRDVTDSRRLDEQLRRTAEINRLLLSKLEPDSLYPAIVESLGRVVKVHYASLALCDKGAKTLRLLAQTFYDGRGIRDSRRLIECALTPAMSALQRGEIIVFQHRDLEAFGDPVAGLVTEGLRTLCSVPLRSSRGVVGVLNVGSRIPDAYSTDDAAALQQLSTHVAIAIENAQIYEEVKELKNRLAEEKLYLEEEIRVDHHFADIIGGSAAIKDVLQQIQTVAATDSTVLILGETGTGKELLARALHDLSPRKDRTFVRVNAAALPAGLLESELFGHERGAFTGAIASKVGRFELADRGTLFLDEVGDVPLELQVKLLRVLQEREFERLGSTRTRRVDVRVIAATNRDLAQMIGEGTFRSDLYYRLNVFPVHVPPLRERRDDIPPLVRYFVQKFSARLRRQITTIPASTMSVLQDWHWPGNIRELENIIERAVILSSGHDLQVPLSEMLPSTGLPPVLTRVRQAREPAAQPTDSPPGTFADGEREMILRVLRESRGIIAGPGGAAARLAMKRTTLQSKMRKLGIKRPSF